VQRTLSFDNQTSHPNYEMFKKLWHLLSIIQHRFISIIVFSSNTLLFSFNHCIDFVSNRSKIERIQLFLFFCSIPSNYGRCSSIIQGKRHFSPSSCLGKFRFEGQIFVSQSEKRLPAFLCIIGKLGNNFNKQLQQFTVC
jgi:hypothetical protein